MKEEENMVEEICRNVWSFPVVLPENPLKWLNCYVIKGDPGERNLLIDTGFNRPECLEALKAGMAELHLAPAYTDVFLTHAHSDHTGNAAALKEMGCRLYMSEIDQNVLHRNTWPERKKRMLSEGMPQNVMDEVFAHNPAVLYAPKYFEAENLHEGDVLRYGGYELECIYTPGHTPGHMCLYDRTHKLMFLGDHVLFTITPNISFWVEADDSLGDYLNSLDKIMTYDVETALPGHRQLGTVTMCERAQELKEHHAARLAETEAIIRHAPGLCAYDIAGRMTWRIRAKNWDEFPPGQKWFAVGEALTHLDYLTKNGRIRRYTDEDGLVRYETI